MVRTRPVNRGGPEDRDIAGTHRRFEEIGMIGQVRRRVGPQVRELRPALVGPPQEVQAAVVFVGLVQGDPDYGAIDGVVMRMHLLIVVDLREKLAVVGSGFLPRSLYDRNQGTVLEELAEIAVPLLQALGDVAEYAGNLLGRFFRPRRRFPALFPVLRSRE